MRLTTDAVILREQNISGDDRVITALTKERGVIRAFVNGAKRLRSKNASSTGMFCYSNITFYKGRDTYTVNEASAIEVFFDIRRDIEKLSLAQYFCEIFALLAPQEEPAEEYVELLVRALYNLASSRRPAEIIKAAAELRLMCLAGYQPDLVACTVCGKYEGGMYFDISEGSLVCGGCAQHAAHPSAQEELSPGVLAAMRHIVYSDAKKLFDFSLSEKGARRLSEITERYVAAQTDRVCKTLEFYRSLNAL